MHAAEAPPTLTVFLERAVLLSIEMPIEDRVQCLRPRWQTGFDGRLAPLELRALGVRQPFAGRGGLYCRGR